MELKFSVIFGMILAVIVLAVATAVWMAAPAYVDVAAIVAVIIFTLLLTKFYTGKVSMTMNGMLTVGILWVIIAAISDVAYAYAFGLNLTAYFSNAMVYVGYVLILVLALVGQRMFGSKKTSAPAAEPSIPAKQP